MTLKFSLILNKNNNQDKIYKSDFGYYDYLKNHIWINLENHYIDSEDEDDLIKNLCNTIAHEYLHYAIWQCRKDFGDKHLYTFFEEWFIAEALQTDFQEEDYYHLVQIEE